MACKNMQIIDIEKTVESYGNTLEQHNDKIDRCADKVAALEFNKEEASLKCASATGMLSKKYIKYLFVTSTN